MNLRASFSTIITTCGLVLLVPLVLVGLPLVIPWAMWSAQARRRRLAKSPCPACGVPFGREEIERAAAACDQTFAELQGDAAARSVIAAWDIGCPVCGAAFTFVPSTDHLCPVEESPVG